MGQSGTRGTIQLWEQRALGAPSCGTERYTWDYTAMGTESFGSTQLWDRAVHVGLYSGRAVHVGLYSYGNRELWEHPAVGQSGTRGTIQLWEQRALGAPSCGTERYTWDYTAVERYTWDYTAMGTERNIGLLDYRAVGQSGT